MLGSYILGETDTGVKGERTGTLGHSPNASPADGGEKTSANDAAGA